jgi:hypothetical protein
MGEAAITERGEGHVAGPSGMAPLEAGSRGLRAVIAL